MATSYQTQIGNALVTALSAVTGHTTVSYRKTEVVKARETPPLTIVTPGFTRLTGRAFGGTAFKDYGFQVAIYRQNLGDITSNMDVNPELVLLSKQAIDLPTLSGLSAVVYGVDIVDDPDAWERQPWRQGAEVSRFGVLVHAQEPQNG